MAPTIGRGADNSASRRPDHWREGAAQNGASSSVGTAGSRANGSRGLAGAPFPDPFPFTAGAAIGPAVSDSRVAHAGNGNSTASGTGISGCDTNIVPGLASV